MKITTVYVMSFKPLADLIRKSMPNLTVIDIKLKEWKGTFVADIKVTDEALEQLRAAEILVTDANIAAQIMFSLPKLKWIQLTWAGIEMLLEAVAKHSPPHCLVTRFSGECFGQAMFEYCYAHIVNRERDFFHDYDRSKLKQWRPNVAVNFRSVDELTVAILGGCGAIGAHLARNFHHLGTRVIGYGRDQRSEDSVKKIPLNKYSTNLNEILADIDYIINVLPSTPQTVGLLNNKALKVCAKRRPVLINIGRGTIIEEREIMRALDKKWIAGAILDVFVAEPLPTSSPLWSRPEILITPHIAAYSMPKDVAQLFVDNYGLFVAGKTLKYRIDWKLGY